MTNPIEKNLEKMLGENNGMNKLLMTESMGGNAGYYKGKSCFAANFYYNGDTGEIEEFTNDFINGNGLHRGTFRLIANVNYPAVIVGTYLEEGCNGSVRDIISKTAFIYNLSVERDFDKKTKNK